MTREQRLIKIVGPLLGGNMNLKWEFVWRRRVRHGLDTVQGRRFYLSYEPARREFSASGTRRVSKRNKRQPVKVSKQMTDYLKSRLLPQHIAHCMRLSIAASR